jgi:hypothetical protein
MADATTVVEGKVRYRDGKKVRIVLNTVESCCGKIFASVLLERCVCFAVEIEMVHFEKALACGW